MHFQKPEITTSRQQQIAIASGALKVAQSFLDPNTALYPVMLVSYINTC